MIERRFPLGPQASHGGVATIAVTFSYDPGDPSVGIGPGWGEDTCAEIIAGPIRTVIIFTNWVEYVDAQTGGTKQREIDHVEEWQIDDVQVLYDEAGGFTPLSTELIDRDGSRRRMRTLNKYPAICEAVKATYEEWQAMEAREVARENAMYSHMYYEELLWRKEQGEDIYQADLNDALAGSTESAQEFDRVNDEFESKYGRP